MNKKPITCALIISFFIRYTDMHVVSEYLLLTGKNALRPMSAVVAPGQPALPPLGVQTTLLYREHVALGATMADFAKWWMPLHYGDAAQENLNTRQGVSIFDETHMGLIDITGKRAEDLINYISSPNVDKDGMRPFNIGDVQYRFLLDNNADVLDDIEVIKLADNRFRLVVNAGNTKKIKAWLMDALSEDLAKFDCAITDLRNAPRPTDSRVILALQGTNGVQHVLGQVTDFDLNSLGYFKGAYIELEIDGKRVRRLVQRTGYTGEDGFELHLHPDEVVGFWKKMLSLGVKPAGLESRDTLRLEAGLPLYGHEWLEKDGPMPFEYKFGFALNLGESGNSEDAYIGRDRAIEKSKSSSRRLVGIKVFDRMSIPANGNNVSTTDGEEIGHVTSGAFSPSLQTSVGLIYIDKEHAAYGTIVKISIAGQDVFAKIVEPPFINHIVSNRARDERENAPYYIPGGEDERAAKLAFIKEKLGIESIDQLFGPLQKYFYNGQLDIPAGISNRELFALLYGLNVEDMSQLTSFNGAGYYNEPGSDLVDFLLRQYKITTAYTPYQPEVSQGNLRLMFLYQSLMAKLLGMDAVNASLYDGSSALAEGVRMAANVTDRKKIIVVGAINIRHKRVLDTYARNGGLEIIYIPQDEETGRVDIKKLQAQMGDDIASIVVQQPNFLGILETEIDKIAKIAKKNKSLLHIHSNDPLAFVKVRTPGSYDADIATAEGQALVGSPYYGGNNLGIIGCKRSLVMFMPGRFVGQTVDAEGNIAFALALTHREQHVGRENATSNICTNVALNALCAAVHMLDLGNSGLNGITTNSHQSAMKFAKEVVQIPGFKVYGSGSVFREVVVESAVPFDSLFNEMKKYGIDISPFAKAHPDFKDKNLIQFCFTGRHTSKDLRDLLEALRMVANDPAVPKDKAALALTANPLVDIPDSLARDIEGESALDIPNIPEPILREAIRREADKNFNPVDNPYPLGSCTMMYNPVLNERIAALTGFSQLHPDQKDLPQGTLRILYELGLYLKELTGMDETSLNPAAGAHGEFAGLTAIFRYHEARGDLRRKVVITTDSSHGTNPASTAMSDAEPVVVKTDPDTGRLNIDDLKQVLAQNEGRIGAIMLTEPNTLGLFEDLETAARLVHEAGGLVYMDGANLNSIVGRIRPGDLGVDVLHINLHKTFSTPHGSGGPGAGPICVKSILRDFIPNPKIDMIQEEQGPSYYYLDDPDGVHVGAFLGNVGVMIRAYAYIRALGQEGLRVASGDAVLNANYLMARLMDEFDIPFARNEPRMHEFVISIASIMAQTHVSANDFAKALQDYGIHPPTVYFPQIVAEAMMFEPTHSMNLDQLDRIANAMIALKRQAFTEPHRLTGAPHNTPIRRVDDSKVQEKGVPLKNDNILAILGIGDEELVAEKVAVVEELCDYEDPIEGWQVDKEQSIPNTDDEEWYRIIELDGRQCAVIGFTQHTVDELNKERDNKDAIKRVFPPKVGAEVTAGEECGAILTSKAMLSINCPVTGKVVQFNKFATKSSEDVNNDPYGRGWLFVVELTEDPAVSSAKIQNIETAQVGINENEATDKAAINIAEFPFASLGMAQVMGARRGAVKIFTDAETNKILGADITGAHAKDLIKVIELAITLDATAEDLADLVFAHPTLPEAIGEAAEAALGRSVHTMPAEKPVLPETDIYDLMIVGAGPAGYVAAIRAAQLGMKVAVMDKGHHGGTCLNRGCIPTKAIIEYLKKHAGSDGIDLEALRANVDGVVGGLRGGIGVLLEANGIDVIQGEFNMQDAARTDDRWDITAGGSAYKAKNLMLATGSVPATLPGLTIDHEKIIDSNDALLLEEIPETLTIVGAGAIGLEFARIYTALGSKVTVVDMADQVCPSVLDRDMAERLQLKMEGQGIVFRLGTAFDTRNIPEGTVLVAVGRVPNTAGLGMTSGLTDRGEIIVNEQYQAEGGPGLLAVGDNIIMRKEDTTQRLPLLAHAASKEGKTAVEALADVDGTKPLYYNDVPAVVFTDPEVATVGLTEEKAESIHLDAEASFFIYSDNESLVKVIVGKAAGIVLGVQIIGPAAPYAIAEMALAVKKNARLGQLMGTQLSPLPTDGPPVWHNLKALSGISSSA